MGMVPAKLRQLRMAPKKRGLVDVLVDPTYPFYESPAYPDKERRRKNHLVRAHLDLDFTYCPLCADSGLPAAWDCTLVETGTADSTLAPSDYEDGGLLLTTDNLTDDMLIAQLKGGTVKLDSGALFFDCGVVFSDATDMGWAIGLSATNVAPFTEFVDVIGFYSPDTSTAINMMTAKDSTETSEAMLAVSVAGTVYRLGFTAIYTAGVVSVQGYINAVAYGDPIITNVPNDELMRLSFGAITGEDNANWVKLTDVRYDHIYV